MKQLDPAMRNVVLSQRADCGTTPATEMVARPLPQRAPLKEPVPHRSRLGVAIRRGALVFATLLPLAACATPQGPQEPVAKDLADAAPSISVLHEKAKLELASSRPTQALSTYTTILDREPNDLAARLGLAEAEFMLGQFDTAAGSYLAVLGHPDVTPQQEAQAHRGAGLSSLALNRTEEASDHLNRAVELDPDSWRAWLGLGRLHDEAEEWDAAEACYAEAVALAPEEPGVHNNHGLSRMAAGDLDGATRLFRQALSLDPFLEVAERNLRLALAFQGRYDEAISGIDAEKRSAMLNDIGYAAIVRKDYEQARILLSQAIDASPSYFEAAWANLRYLDAIEKRELRVGFSAESRI